MPDADVITLDELEIDLTSYRLTKNGELVRLTPTEWALLREFATHPNQVLTHRTLLRRVWGEEYTSENDYVHTYVSRLRRKLEKDPTVPQTILTEAGLGYRFNYTPPEVPTPPPLAAQVADVAPSPPRPTAVNPLPQHIDERYVGREAQRDQLRDLLLANTRLVSIYGRAGVGKTALASKVLGDLQAEGRFTGMLLLSATSTGIGLGRILSDFDRLLGENGATTPPDQRPTIHRITHLLDRLRGGDYILLLDNLEHLQDPQTNDLTDKDIETLLHVALEQGSTLRIVVTSRYPLNLPRTIKMHERIIALEEGLTIADGVQLLRHSDPDDIAGLKSAPQATLEQLVRRTHGLPRALEAVVGILLEDPLMTPDDLLHDEALLAEELGELFIQGAIDNLSAESVRLMELVSVFERAVSLDMLRAFAQPHLEGEALKPILNRLIRAYFLSYAPQEQTVSMHPIDRAYCYQRLPAAQRPALHRQVADLYQQRYRAEQHVPTRIADLADALSAFQHWVLAQEHDTAAALLLELDRAHLSIWGNYTELADGYAQVIEHGQDAGLQRRALLRSGEALRRVGRLQNAISRFERAYALASSAADGQHMATALSGLAWAHYDTGQFTDAIRYWENALGIFREIDDRYGEGDSLSGMGWVSYLMGSYDQALNYIREAFTIFGDMGNQLHRIGMNIGDSGMIRAAQGDYDAALNNLEESLSIANVTNSINEKSYKGGYLATVLLLAGQTEAAETAARAAAQHDAPANRHVVEAVHGVALARMGRTDDAIEAFRRTVSDADQLLRYSPGLYNTRYARALALAGLALLQNSPINAALDEYGRAKALCSAEGVLQAQGRLLALLKRDGDEQLVPVQRVLNG